MSDGVHGGDRPPAGPTPHVVVADVDDPTLDDEARHHLGRVRRRRDGDACTVTDGRGAWRWCRYRAGGTLEIDGEIRSLDRPEPAVSIAVAVTKGDRPTWTVQKLTELGVDRVTFFTSDRTVVRWDAATAASRIDRLHSVARGAVEQSGGCWLPTVDGPVGVDALVDRAAIRLDPSGRPLRSVGDVVAVGPEGGWSEAEIETLPTTAGLGPRVLRAETAALTAGALLCSLRSGIVRPAVEGVHGA